MVLIHIIYYVYIYSYYHYIISYGTYMVDVYFISKDIHYSYYLLQVKSTE